MSLINWKVELKLKWLSYCVLSAAVNDNANGNNNNHIFIIKDIKLYVPVITLSARDDQKLTKIFSKGFEISVYWNQFETKSKNKNTTNECRYFLESSFAAVNSLFVLVYSNEDADSKKIKAKRYYLPKGMIKNYNVIINEKSFYDQAIDSDIKQYEDIRKLTTEQGEDYTTGCLLDYDYKKRYFSLIDLSN